MRKHADRSKAVDVVIDLTKKTLQVHSFPRILFIKANLFLGKKVSKVY